MVARRARAISPVIATVIILAVTIAIAIAVVGWVMGVFKSASHGQAQLKVYANSTLCTDGNANLTIANEGGTSAKIVSIKIGGVTYTCHNVVLNPGDVKTITLGTATTDNCTATSASFVTGVTYNVNIYTASGNLFTAVLTAQSCK